MSRMKRAGQGLFGLILLAIAGTYYYKTEIAPRDRPDGDRCSSNGQCVSGTCATSVCAP